MTATPLTYDDAYLRSILQRVRTIAMVGASMGEMRPSYFAMLYLQGKGFRIIPVNPRYAGQTLLGETVYPDLASLPQVPDMVQIFRRSEAAGAIADDAVRLGVGVIWMQLGVRDDEAALRVRAAGREVVMDRCPKIESTAASSARSAGWASTAARSPRGKARPSSSPKKKAG